MTREQLEAIRSRWADGPREDWTIQGPRFAGEWDDVGGWDVVGGGLIIAAGLNQRRAEFIAHAPADIEALLGYVGRLKAALLEEWEANHTEHCRTSHEPHMSGCYWPKPAILEEKTADAE